MSRKNLKNDDLHSSIDFFSIGTFYHKDHDPFISTVASISRFRYKNYAQRKSTYLICGNIEQHNL